jgi:hypothetical protein
MLNNITKLSISLLLSLMACQTQASLSFQSQHDQFDSGEGSINWSHGLHDYSGHALSTSKNQNESKSNLRFNETLSENDELKHRIDKHELKFTHKKEIELESDGIQSSPVPIPSSALLLGSGLLGLIALAFKRKPA